jgi:energy-coupling factor transporter ATP-binding protein EcfA2
MDEELEEFNLDNPKYFLGRTTILYGESGSGKSTIAVHILKTLSRLCDQIIVFSPSDPQNKTYSKGMVPTPLIHYTVSLKVLQDIWERQEMMAAVYKRANNPDVLQKLYRRLNLPHVDESLSKARKMREETIKKIEEQYMDKGIVAKKKEEVDEKFNELVSLIYKRYIAEHRRYLMGVLSPADTEEKFCLEYLGFNPNMVVVFDDCSSQLQTKEIKKSKVFKDMFYRNRWAHISVIICAHNDKNLEQDIRKNSFVSIFTTKACATGFFTNKTNYFDADTISMARSAIKHIQEPKVGHQRLAYLREENKFYRVTAKIFPDFSFGSPIVKQFCEKIRDHGEVSVDRNNKFFDKFFKDEPSKK